MGTINFTAYKYKYMKKQVTLLKREKIGIIFNWKISTKMLPLPPIAQPLFPKI